MRQAVIILGMHRSGTSAVAGAVTRLGLAAPERRSRQTPDNPTGFHEPLPLIRLNDLVLKFLGCSWNACLSLDPDISTSGPGDSAGNMHGDFAKRIRRRTGFRREGPPTLLTLRFGCPRSAPSTLP